MKTCKKCGGEVKTVSSPQNGPYSICIECREVYIHIEISD